MSSSTGWDYYGRRGATNQVFELYRMPADAATPQQKLAAKQRLRQGLFWTEVPDDTALAKEWASGWFSFEDDRLTIEQADALVRAWAEADHWPGRP